MLDRSPEATGTAAVLGTVAVTRCTGTLAALPPTLALTLTLTLPRLPRALAVGLTATTLTLRWNTDDGLCRTIGIVDIHAIAAVVVTVITRTRGARRFTRYSGLTRHLRLSLAVLLTAAATATT